MLSLLSAVMPVILSGFIGAFVAWHASERQGIAANVTQERAKWRDRIRSLATELCDAVANDDKAQMVRLAMAFRLSLNPWDRSDREIVALVRSLPERSDRNVLMERVAVRLEMLLKHDWERAKAEASWAAFGRRGRTGRRGKPGRAGVAALADFRRRNPIGGGLEEDATY